MFCPNCGAQIPDDSIFCDKCGCRVGGGISESMELTAAEVKDGGISKLSNGSQIYTRP